MVDAGEYLRAVFDNFRFDCKGDDENSESCRAVSTLRKHYTKYSTVDYTDGRTSLEACQQNVNCNQRHGLNHKRT